MKFSGSRILIALIVATASAFGTLWLRSFTGDEAAISAVSIAQVVITFWTGWWYWNRMRYTEERGVPKPGMHSVLFSSAIMIVALICFFVVGRPIWFALHALVLLLAIEKDVEIIIAQRRLLKIKKGENEIVNRWRRYIVVHHWYSVLRDLSMGIWWIVAGVFMYVFQTEAISTFLLFAVPYSLLVLGWYCLKISVMERETLHIGLPKVKNEIGD